MMEHLIAVSKPTGALQYAFIVANVLRDLLVVIHALFAGYIGLEDFRGLASKAYAPATPRAEAHIQTSEMSPEHEVETEKTTTETREWIGAVRHLCKAIVAHDMERVDQYVDYALAARLKFTYASIRDSGLLAHRLSSRKLNIRTAGTRCTQPSCQGIRAS